MAQTVTIQTDDIALTRTLLGLIELLTSDVSAMDAEAVRNGVFDVLDALREAARNDLYVDDTDSAKDLARRLFVTADVMSQIGVHAKK